MLTRSCARCTTRLRATSFKPRVPSARVQTRQYAMPAGNTPPSVNSVGALAPFVTELDRLAPSFDVRGEQIQIIRTPAEFYETLKEALRKNPDVKLSILTDALRGTREAPNPSSASLLAPLVEEFGADRVEIRMYHTPNLTGLRKQYIPKRINEGWGLQHMKLYGVDDEIIMSGFLVQPSTEPAGFTLSWPQNNSTPSPLEKPQSFIKSTTSTLQTLLHPTSKPENDISDTRVYMLGQMSQVMKPDTSTELPVITHILKTLALPAYRESSWTFTAGYFNPAPSLTKLLLNTASTSNTVITASPEANGFYKSKGVSGLLPDAYTLLARRFVHRVHHEGRDNDITLKEWRYGVVGQPGGWTYHAKGLWVTMPGDKNPAMSIIGSSNYTKRSYSHDLEAGALIVTRDEGLKGRLGEEQLWLQEHATKATRDDFARTERRVGLKVRVAMWIVSLVGGAL
ncbi:hypothetical protein BFJ68_g440 [Fusarium oxysporum]|uniref:CDP-diacylglycerol--glycerol-3-phosphate 3-phosphatidyltransferase n=1 Tax=Fusarium oxysporum TaxID=5507 RepID=A0A420S939_FUSOX|nr:hypothetical protein BFJ68_g440 [Fusarium oxysporum]